MNETRPDGPDRIATPSRKDEPMTDPTRCPDRPRHEPVPIVDQSRFRAFRFDTEDDADEAADALMERVAYQGDVETRQCGMDWIVRWTARTGNVFFVTLPIGGDR